MSPSIAVIVYSNAWYWDNAATLLENILTNFEICLVKLSEPAIWHLVLIFCPVD